MPLMTRVRRLLDRLDDALDVEADAGTPALSVAPDGQFWAWTITAPGLVLACGTGVDRADAEAKGLRVLGELDRRIPA